MFLKILLKDYVFYLTLFISLCSVVPGKNPEWQKSFPVIVMEMLSEGDVLSYLATSKHISEKTLADLFRSIVDAVSSVHKKGFIHR